MYINSYKYQPDPDKTPIFVADIYHNRAEVYGANIASKTFFYYEDIGEILAHYNMLDIADFLEVE